MRRANARLGGGRRGFTLVETLVVIGIAVILAALVFSGGWYARQRARVFQCATNLRQLGIAVVLYEKDYGDTMPLVYPMDWYGPKWKTPPLPPQPWATPQYVLGDYISTPGIFVCPIYHAPYAFNSSVSGMRVPPGYPKWAGPHWTMTMYDNAQDDHPGPWAPHLGRVNAVFLDGHMATYKWIFGGPPAPNVRGLGDFGEQ